MDLLDLLDLLERLERVDWADLVLWQREEARFRRFWDMQRCRFLFWEDPAMLTIQGCLRAWPAVSRSLGSTIRTRSTKSLARLDTLGHGCGQETGDNRQTQNGRCEALAEILQQFMQLCVFTEVLLKYFFVSDPHLSAETCSTTKTSIT